MQTLDTSSVSRNILQKLLDYLDANDIQYTLDNRKETIIFDLTELSPTNQKWVNATFKSIKESRMTNDQKKRIKPLLKRLIMEVRSELKEAPEQLMSQDLKIISQYVNGLGAAPALRHSIDDKFILQKAEEINKLRIEIMNYVEENSAYRFYGKSPSEWKLVKK